VGILSRRSASAHGSPLSTAKPDDLSRLGEIAFGGQVVHPPGIAAIPTAELDGYAMAFLAAAGHPPSGSSVESAASSQFLDELTSSAELAGDWGFVGAMFVAWNSVPQACQEDRRFWKIIDRALEEIRLDGVAWTAVPRFALDRWQSVRGYGESGPLGWPSSLAYLPLPASEDAPPVDDLADGEARRLAQAPSNPANTIFAERRGDGSIQAVVEGIDPETGAARRWDWEGVSAADYPSFLRELGDRLITHSQWADDDLVPYFPCRQRSREEMRIEARAQVLP
jgi:hypothetical protein